MRKDISNTNQDQSNYPQSRRSNFLSPWGNDFWEPGSWDNFFSPELSSFDSKFLSPAIDVEESDNEYLVSADLPGLKKEDISIDCSGNQLTISAERKYEKQEGKKQGRRERFYGTYQRSFTLPVGVDTNKIDAAYDGGVLTVHIPKGENIKSKHIPIGSGRFTNKH